MIPPVSAVLILDGKPLYLGTLSSQMEESLLALDTCDYHSICHPHESTYTIITALYVKTIKKSINDLKSQYICDVVHQIIWFVSTQAVVFVRGSNIAGKMKWQTPISWNAHV